MAVAVQCPVRDTKCLVGVGLPLEVGEDRHQRRHSLAVGRGLVEMMVVEMSQMQATVAVASLVSAGPILLDPVPLVVKRRTS